MFEYKHDGIYFRCHEKSDGDRELKIDNNILNFIDKKYFLYKESNNEPFDPKRDNIIFDPLIKKICFRIFDVVKKMYDENIEERYSSLLVARLFEAFAGYWANVLLSKNQDRIGIIFWKKVLAIVKEWREKNPNVFIHTGTPYYFLAENCLMVGDLDSAFTYLHDANFIDQQSWQWKYPDHMGAYCLAKLLDKKNSQMNYIVQDLRKELMTFMAIFNSEYGIITLDDFDNKFLRNEKELLEIGYFFTYTFFCIIQNKRNEALKPQENNFLKLRSLDLIFNLCLIIDEILRDTYLKNETDPSKTTISYGIAKLCDERRWTNSYKLIKHWESSGKFDDSHSDKIIELLLAKTETYQGNPVEKQVFTLILAYKLRNYGAHNLNRESIVIQKYDEIVRELMFGLFISVLAIK